MAKYLKQKSSGKRQYQASGEAKEKFKDRDLSKVNPLDQQFEPTDAEPVRQHQKMAGC